MNQQLDLFEQLSYYEGADVEYKAAGGGLPRDLWETYSAFANTEGGTIWLGVAQKQGRLVLQGVENPEKLLSDFWNLANNRNKISRNLLREANVEIKPLPAAPGRALISIDVPRAGRRERPIFVGLDPLKGTFRRNFEGDYVCTEDEVRRMFADQAEEPADSRILPEFAWEDLDLESIQQFRNRFRSRAPEHAWLNEDDRGLLEKLGGWRRDRRTGLDGMTLAGLLMFGRSEAITAPEGMPGYQIDYRERLSEDPEVRWSDRLTIDGNWEANLFQFYQRVVLKLASGPGVKAPFQRDAEGYRRTATPVHEALQEALVNALIHSDYSGQGGVVIDRYPDRFEFSNPGTLLVSREQLLRGGVSECSNKSLQKMFQMLGVGDKAGSGIDRIRTNWAAQHWQSPRLRETLRPDRVQLVLQMVSTLPQDAVDELDRRFGEAFRKLSPDEVQAVVAAEVEAEITNQRLQEMLALHRVDITRLLQGLVRQGFLVAEGIGRGTRYALAPKSGRIKPEIRGVSPPDLSEHPPGIDVERTGFRATAEDACDPQLVPAVLLVRKAGKASAGLVRKAILVTCAGRFVSLRELSELLNRQPETLRDSYVSRMVREGLLELRYPEKPSHRDQAYRAASSPPEV